MTESEKDKKERLEWDHKPIITINIGFSKSSEVLLATKKQCENAVDLLGNDWTYTLDKEGFIQNRRRWHAVNIMPKSKKISAEQFRKVKPILFGINDEMFTEYFSSLTEEQQKTKTVEQWDSNIMFDSTTKEIAELAYTRGFLLLKILISDANELDNCSPEMSKVIFDDDLETFFSTTWRFEKSLKNWWVLNKNGRKLLELMRKRLKDWYDIEV